MKISNTTNIVDPYLSYKQINSFFDYKKSNKLRKKELIEDVVIRNLSATPKLKSKISLPKLKENTTFKAETKERFIKLFWKGNEFKLPKIDNPKKQSIFRIMLDILKPVKKDRQTKFSFKCDLFPFKNSVMKYTPKSCPIQSGSTTPKLSHYSPSLDGTSGQMLLNLRSNEIININTISRNSWFESKLDWNNLKTMQKPMQKSGTSNNESVLYPSIYPKHKLNLNNTICY